MSDYPPTYYYMRGRGTLASLNSDVLNEISTWLVGPSNAVMPIDTDFCRHCGNPDLDFTHHACFKRHQYCRAFPLLANSIAAFFPDPANAILFIDQRCENTVRSFALSIGWPYPPRSREVRATAASITLRNYPTPKAVAEYEPYARAELVDDEDFARGDCLGDLSYKLGILSWVPGIR
jgi:hypothetical protein